MRNNFYIKYLRLFSTYIILIFFYLSQIIKCKLIRKKRISGFNYYNLNIIGPGNDWILSTIKKYLLLNKKLSDKKSLKVNFFLHYSIFPFKPILWFDSNPNILFFTHEDKYKYRPRYLYRNLFFLYDYIFCMNNDSNEFISKIISKNKIINLEKVKTNHFAGVSNEFAKKAQKFERPKFKKDNFINLGFHCRPYKRKRPELMPEIMKFLPNFKLICCGEGHSEKDFYSELISSKRIEFKNYKFEDLHFFYSEIDILICCSVFEGGPTPLVEANAFGIPFLSTDVGFAKEVASEHDKIVGVNSSAFEISQCLIQLSQNIGSKSKKIVTWEEIVNDFYFQIKNK